VIGQALVAASRMVDVGGRHPHSLHAYFLLASDARDGTLVASVAQEGLLRERRTGG
jgi:acyl-CoA thioesterase